MRPTRIREFKMTQFSTLSSVMEAETISKNEASSKSQTSRRHFLIACFALLAAGIIIIACSGSIGTQSERWEYKIESLSYYSEETTNILNALGKEGWEVVAVTHQSMHSSSFTYTLKRRL